MRLLANLLLPPVCAACGVPETAGALCRGCAAHAEALRLPAGAPLLLADGVLAVAAYAYEGVVRDAVLGMKLHARHGAARGFAPLLRDVAARYTPPEAAVTWVPATRRRVRERGVDLPRLLAGSDAINLLARRSERPDQTTLSLADRRASPAGSFVACASPPRRVLLVDDVRTTGATARAAAAALRAAGARRVLVVTLAAAGVTPVGAAPTGRGRR